ncbi:MAG: hypothetical protein QF531_00935 [Candidatus Poseidonia sp.]|nr:hypothetical protein [Poseidonia sp.]
MGQVQGCGELHLLMEEKEGGDVMPSPQEDDVLREQSFKRAKGLNLGSFMVQSDNRDESSLSDTEEPLDAASKDRPEPTTDAAVGELGELFTNNPSTERGVDSTTYMATQAEQQISRGLAVAMVVVWTAIGALVGTVLPPLLGGLGLLSMALFGLYLGERWIKRDSMHFLGLTWVIISMKLLYGLALDAWRWGWLDSVGPGASQTLGVVMLGLVGLNVGLAFRHDEDAIAAQSALVLFAVGSSAGAVYGEIGIAAFMVLAMVLMHGLALIRSSGNLASLGISISYLWVGVHALSNDWTVLSLTLLPLENDLTLFLLLTVVTAANAAMAARFVHHENWLSQAVHAVGLGKPGLWAVSVSLGMVGALMAIAAHRTETGYALAQLMLLTLAFTASYLVVRGVPWPRLMPFVLAPLPFMIAGVGLFNSGAIGWELPFGLEAYSLFAALSALLCTGVLLNHQANVSDHVLWMGSLVVVVLLTLLIPAEDGGQTARLLLVSQAVVWVGLAALAVLRHSPTMAGVAVLAPYIWLLAFATDLESRLVNADLVPIALNEVDAGWWMLALVVQQIVVCMRLGEANLNLAAGIAGFSEISTRIRDANVLNLWNLSFFLTCLTYLAMARPDGLTALGLQGGMGLLLVSHAAVVWRGHHLGRPQTLVIVWSVSSLGLTWQYGDEALWSTMLTLGSALLLLGAVQQARLAAEEGAQHDRHRALPGRLLTLHLSVMMALFLVVALAPQRLSMLTGQGALLSIEQNLWLLTAVGGASLGLYLYRLNVVDALLLPTAAALALLVSMALAGQASDVDGIQLSALVLFVLVGVYLAFQGDVRAGLRAVTTKQEREAAFAEKRERMEHLVSTTSKDGTMDVTLKELDAELLELAERQRKRAKRADTSASNDLLVGDIHYRPVVLMLFLSVCFLASMWMAYATAYGLMALIFSAAFSFVLVGLARLRADSIGLRLPDVAGVELPIIFAMCGMVLVHIAGRMTVGVLSDDAVHQTVLMVTLVLLAVMGVMGRNDLGLRIPSVLEAVLGLLVIDRLLGLLLGGEVPVPFSIDPLNGDLMTWVAPLLLGELILLRMLWSYDWVEGERLRRDLADHRTALGRSAWMGGMLILSVGPAAVLAMLAGTRRGRSWQQPAVALTAVVCIPLAVQSLSAWLISSLFPPLTMALVTATVGLLSLGWTASVVRWRLGLWLPASLWATHAMLYAAAMMASSLVLLSLAATIVSATAWLSGILTRRKSWRIIGAVDLVVAWLVAAVALVAGATAAYVLLLLIASAILLFAVTTLTQSNEAELLND